MTDFEDGKKEAIDYASDALKVISNNKSYYTLIPKNIISLGVESVTLSSINDLASWVKRRAEVAQSLKNNGRLSEIVHKYLGAELGKSEEYYKGYLEGTINDAPLLINPIYGIDEEKRLRA